MDWMLPKENATSENSRKSRGEHTAPRHGLFSLGRHLHLVARKLEVSQDS